MRMIDADALNKVLQKKVGSPTDDKLYNVNLCIIDAPTVEAIPVEWLKQMLNETIGDDNWAVFRVLWMWENEQGVEINAADRQGRV